MTNSEARKRMAEIKAELDAAAKAFASVTATEPPLSQPHSSEAHSDPTGALGGSEGVEAIRALLAKWSGCWCETQMSYDHDPRVQDCPQHGDDSCRHMAKGITVDLRALLAPAPASETASEHLPIDVYEMPEESAEALLSRIEDGTAVLAMRVCSGCAPSHVVEAIEDGTLDLSDGDALDAQWPCSDEPAPTPPTTVQADRDAGQVRLSVADAIKAWEDKGPTSLTVALMADALYGVAARQSDPDATEREAAWTTKTAFDGNGWECPRCGLLVAVAESMPCPAGCRARDRDEERVRPGLCWHDSGIIWPNSTATTRCELRHGHAGAHECDRGAMGGSAHWTNDAVTARVEWGVRTDGRALMELDDEATARRAVQYDPTTRTLVRRTVTTGEWTEVRE